MSKVIDQAVREALLNPGQSFIVQAPAGSGKTELLTQRILALLEVVDKPENILAITFTRKAAAEMRERVVSALILGQGPEPSAPHELFRWRLAQRVLNRDKAKNWQLVGNPARLNITTIDSLSSSLSAALPLLSQTGAMPSIEEDSTRFYQLAVEALMRNISNNDETAQNIAQLLKHKDNNLQHVNELLAQMLAKRLQWLAPLKKHNRAFKQSSIESSLIQIATQLLSDLYSSIPQHIIGELAPILNFASTQLNRLNIEKSPRVRALNEVGAIKQPTISDLANWQAIAELFLTQKGEFVKSLTKNNGFPAKSDATNNEEKQQFEQIKKDAISIAKLLAEESNVLEGLKQVALFPNDISASASQPSLKAVVQLLPKAADYLKEIFSRYNVVDFPELSLAALDALGHDELPTDLALALDYRLEHILIDEFQDTSSPQIQLIESLVREWLPESGRSIFLVGDPMQSIYRFRDANVSLFMQIREQGIANIPLEFKQLQVNFRSSEKVVNWVNEQFSRIMPAEDNLTLSAVSYAPSVAFNKAQDDDEVESCLMLSAENYQSQADYVLDIAKQHLENNQKYNDDKTLAILARSRSHLVEIVEQLNQASIVFEAIELDSLAEKAIVRDLCNFAFALTDEYDELSWACCMRAPWFGLCLNDIRTILIESSVNQPLLSRIRAVTHQLSTEGRKRSEKVLPLLEAAMELKGEKPFRKWISGCFEAVGGFLHLDFDSEKEDFFACLDKLTELNDGGELNDRKKVNDSIARLYAAPNPNANGQVQLMTIHKSKGLEFDTVILPSLDKTPPVGEQSLLKWTEVIDSNGQANSLLAVSKETGGSADEVYQYISYLDKRKSEFEAQRVLYVAATRAKRKLYLIGNAAVDEKKGEIKKANKGSYLSLLWDGVIDSAKTIDTSLSFHSQPGDVSTLSQSQKESLPLFESRNIKRSRIENLPNVPMVKPEDLLDEIITSDIVEQQNPKELLNHQALAKAIGNIIHRQLEWVSLHWRDDFELPNNWITITQSQLSQSITLEPAIQETAVTTIVDAVDQTLRSEFGRFILSKKNSASSELVLHKKLEGGHFLTRIIDRTFVDSGIRWVVDYKSSQPEEAEILEHFLAREKAAYHQQMTDYFNMFTKLEEKPIKAGLYFPVIDHFELMLSSD